MTRPNARDETESISSRLEEISLALPVPVLDMTEVAVAIANVASSAPAEGALFPQSPEPPSSSTARRTGRRRTSSRADLAPHSVADEEPPLNRFHDPVVQQGFRDAMTLTRSLTNILESSSLHTDPDSIMRLLHRRASDLSNSQLPSTRTVGFVGDSGVGE